MSNNLDEWLHKEVQQDPDVSFVPKKVPSSVNTPAAKKETSFVRGLFTKKQPPAAAAPQSRASTAQGSTSGHSKPAPTGGRRPTPTKQRSSSHTTNPRHRGASPAPREVQNDRTPIPKGPAMKFIAIGGLEEIGRNCAAFEYEDSMFLLDVGLEFPGPDLMGIDYIVPDVSYVEKNIKKLKGIVITHGHLDHIGALKVILPKLNFPMIYGPALALGLIRKQVEETGMADRLRMTVVKPRDVITIGKMKIEFFRVNHSIPDGHGVYIESPEGKVVHTGDFKFDFTPAIDEPADLGHIAEIGSRGIDLLMVDSTNATQPGHTKSEKIVGQGLERIVKDAEGRVIITTFSSLIGRIQQLITYAQKYGRTVYLSGRSMITNVEIARELGFISYPPGAVQQIGARTNTMPPERVMIITTGCQGEEMSALARMAFGSHPHIKIRKGDTIVLSSTPIPGNERGVVNLMNNLSVQGATIIDNDATDVHTSGHARQDDIKLMLSLIRPKHYLPVHGEIFMRIVNGKIAQEMGVPEKNVFRIPNGGILEFRKGHVTESREKLDIGYIMIDGSSEGMAGSKVVAERQIMARDGMIVLMFKVDKVSKELLATPKMVSKGFVYMDELPEVSKGILNEARRIYERVNKRRDMGKTEKQTELVRVIRADIARYVKSKTDRLPMILPIISEQ